MRLRPQPIPADSDERHNDENDDCYHSHLPPLPECGVDRSHVRLPGMPTLAKDHQHEPMASDRTTQAAGDHSVCIFYAVTSSKSGILNVLSFMASVGP
jgi:hypothetical protein